ncbi:sulfatase-like hydrolase/transferase [Saliphagus sp. GCM10025308]
MGGISDLADGNAVENVLIYIVDSLRLDYLPERVSDLGVTVPTIAASTYTASSIPSMMTGQYPATHRVWGFNDVVERSPKLLEGPNAGLDLRNVWVDIDDPVQKPPNRVLDLEKQHNLNEAEDGFTIVVHEKGAHAPYDFFNVKWDSSPPFFEHFAGKSDQLENMYKRGAETAADRFLDTVDQLSERDLLEDTLVIFTSDHGELLGEIERGGIYAHGSPICPELVRVPTVFMGAGLPSGKRLEWVSSGTDLAPTAMSATNRGTLPNVDGIDLWTITPDPNRIVRSDFWAHGGTVEYSASSAWDSNGGFVKQFGSPLERIIFAIHRKLYKGLQAPANRAQLPRSFLPLVQTFGKSALAYGSPSEMTHQYPVSEFEENKGETEVPEVNEEQLRALGYID